MTAITGRTRPRLLVRDAGGQYRQASAEEVLRQARLVLARRCRRGTQLRSPDAAADFLRLKMGALEYEMFTVVFVDAAHRLIEIKEMFRGTVSETTVHAREVIKEALAVNAAAVILAHNHPSGKAEPSRADRLLTQSLVYALAMVDVRVLDHLVITSGRIVSFARRGFL